MGITALIFGIIGTIFGVISLLFSLILVSQLINKDSIEPPKQNNGIDEPSKEYKEGFASGGEYLWATFQLAMFDMYINMEILDFDEQINGIRDRMGKISGDQKYIQKVINKFNEYMEEQNDSNGY